MADREDSYWEAVNEIQQLIEAQNSDLDSTIEKTENIIIALKNKLTQDQINSLFRIQNRFLRKYK